MRGSRGRHRVATVHVLALFSLAPNLVPALASEGGSSDGPSASSAGGQPSSSNAVAPLDSGSTGTGALRGGWLITPSISVLETYTDNVALAPSNRKESDFITSVTPGLRIEGKGARANLSLVYRRHELLYAGESDRNSSQNFLNATGSLEAIERWLFIDAGATITQQAISAFGSQPTVTENVSSNRVETSSYFISPYIRGRLGSAAEYNVRYRWTAASSDGNALADSDVSEWSGNLGSTARGTLFGWRLDASRQANHVDTRRSTELRLVRGTLLYHYDSDLTFSLNAGHESNNYSTASTESRVTYGGGFEWVPSPRARVAGTTEKRFFGESHEFTLDYRTPLSSWQFLDRRVVTVLPPQLALPGQATAYDLLFDALTSRFPDPALRAQEVQRVLQQNGTPENLGLQTGFLTTRAFVERIQQASFALLGTRNTITFTATRTTREGIGEAGGGPDDFTLSSEIETRTIGASWAHRFSALSSANLLATRIQTKGSAGTNLESVQDTVRLIFSHRLGPRTSGSIGLRYVRFDPTTGLDYTEKAVTASVSTTF